MPRFEDIVKKAFYMGVGIASYAQERAGDTLVEIKSQAQKLADEMIARGEINVDEARKFVDDMVRQAQQDIVEPSENKTEKKSLALLKLLAKKSQKLKNPIM
jgi:polyhydroxyalkanoate synthesis regulator phasin